MAQKRSGNTRKKAASTGRPRADYASKPAKPSQGGVPGWLWMLAGLLVGLFVAFLVYLQQQKAHATASKPPVIAKAPEKKTTPPPKAPIEDKTTERKGINFDFYNILPEMEVVIPEEELKKPEGNEPLGNYIMQVGSFKTAAQADTRKAQLALLGLSSSVQTVTVDNKQTWYRVRLGPYSDRRELDRVRRMLQDNDIDFVMMKVKG